MKYIHDEFTCDLRLDLLEKMNVVNVLGTMKSGSDSSKYRDLNTSFSSSSGKGLRLMDVI